ncbi:protein transport protein Sec24C isoform X2 [Diorhabda sublineata]|uniref:protein transport protein Sec24C isoform X2 n=1 Tax=Diorhabda sublineata TaxID=1163346 RepID=UPI0024E08502|nr:protein transport protein Sec24C isoform X2 [Diorhabda sublineata]
MNPHYLSQQQFGGPPQGFPPTSRVSPNTTPQSFQNIPLGPPKASQSPSGDHLPLPSSLGQSLNTQSGQFPPNFQNGPPSSQFQNGQMSGSIPTSNPNRPPSNFAPSPHTQSNFGPSIPSNSNLPPRPPSNNSNNLEQPPLSSGPPSLMGGISALLSQPSNKMGQPHFSGGPPSQMGQPSLSSGAPSQTGQPPLTGGPPSQMGQPPLSGGPPSQMGKPPLLDGPPSQMGQKPLFSGAPSQTGQSLLSDGPPSQMGQLSLSGGAPSQMGQPPLSSGPPSQMGQPPLSSGPPSQLVHGGQLSQMGQPSLPRAPPSQMGQPSLPGGPSPQMNQPPLMSDLPPQIGQSSFPGGPPQGMGQGPAQQMRHPPLSGMPPQQMGHPPLPGGPPPFGSRVQQNGQFGPPSNQFNNQVGPPKPGQVPLQSRTGQPPFPGQGPYSNISGPYPPSGQGSQMPPPPGQQYGPGQITNQLHQMNLTGPKPVYPVGGPMRPMNGESGPHMPPLTNQPGYQNGPQTRRPPGPGYPPMPGQAPLPGQGQYPSSTPYPEQPKQKQLDPDDVPSPIQVFQEDQINRGGIFVTNDKGLMPPLVTTNFIVQDQGNCSPRFIRSTMYNIPFSQDISKQTAIPFSLIISPMARQVEQEYPPPVVDFGALGPVRCIRCKAYMCPYMQFVDSGRRFQCLFCMATTDVPTEYFQHLDQSGLRMDRFERPELILGTYEFVATSDYCRNNTLPKPPAFIFVIDVSYNNVKSGMLALLCSQMKDILQNLPVDQGQEKSNMKVGFITYSSSVHFYNIKGTLAAPQMMVVGDVQDMFMPLLDGFLCTPEESEAVIDLLMQQIPKMFEGTRETETILLPAIQAGLEALKASECAGKLLVFHSSLPTAEAPGKLKNRDDRKLLGTDKEKTVLTPQTQAYNQLGQECVSNGCCVDLFIFNNAYIDLATIGQVSRLTGGEVFKYTYFQADLDGERLINDIILDISRPIAFDAVMRVRTSAGVRPTDFYGHFYMSNTTDIELAALDCDKAIGVEIKHDDKLTPGAGTYIQAALLYTSCSGQRRLRIMNLSLKTCSEMADIYRSCDLDTLLNYMSKQATYKLLDNNPKAIKDSLINRAAQILATYRKHCASPSSAGQLILPECMKLLPVYINCLLKNDVISGGADMTIDDKSFVMQAVMTMDVSNSVYFFYPRLIPLHTIDLTSETVTIPSPIRCTINKMSEQGAYILENGIHMFLWFGLGVNPDFIQKLFGAPSAIQVDIDRINLPELDNPLSVAVRSIIDEIRIQRHRCMRLTLVRQREKLEPVFKHFLVEDRGVDGSASYVDFLCHMHKEIRQILS